MAKKTYRKKVAKKPRVKSRKLRKRTKIRGGSNNGYERINTQAYNENDVPIPPPLKQRESPQPPPLPPRRNTKKNNEAFLTPIRLDIPESGSREQEKDFEVFETFCKDKRIKNYFKDLYEKYNNISLKFEKIEKIDEIETRLKVQEAIIKDIFKTESQSSSQHTIINSPPPSRPASPTPISNPESQSSSQHTNINSPPPTSPASPTSKKGRNININLDDEPTEI